MPSNQLDQIKDEALKAAMTRASVCLDDGRNYECVRECADAYLLLLDKHPEVRDMLKQVMATDRVKAGLERGMIRFAPPMWPRMASKLQIDEAGKAAIVFDRQQLGFGETIQYYEFTMTLIVDADNGRLSAAMPGGGGLGLG